MRRRLLAAILIIASTLGALAWVDILVLLRNPTELDTRARLLLAKLFPDYNAKIHHIEVDFPSHVTLEQLELDEKGTSRALVKIEKVEANLSLTDWLAPRDVLIRGVRVNVRLDKQGNLNFKLPESKPPASGAPASGGGGIPFSSAVSIIVQDARLGFEDEDTASRSLLRC